MDKLDFHFRGEEVLYAQLLGQEQEGIIVNGSVPREVLGDISITEGYPDTCFEVSGYFKKKVFRIKDIFPSIYEALDAANKWWEEHKDKGISDEENSEELTRLAKEIVQPLINAGKAQHEQIEMLKQMFPNNPGKGDYNDSSI